MNKTLVAYSWILSIQQAIDANCFHYNPLELHNGDVQAGFQTCDHIMEGELSIGGQEHFYMENQSVVITSKCESNEIEVFAGTQDLTFLQVHVKV